MDSLAKFIADITMAAPVTERGSSAGTPAPELNGEGKAFFEAAHAFAEGIDGSATPSSAVIEGYLGLILAQLPRVLDSAAPDAGAPSRIFRLHISGF